MSAVGVGIIGSRCHQRHLPGEPGLLPGRRGRDRRRPERSTAPARRPRSTASRVGDRRGRPGPPGRGGRREPDHPRRARRGVARRRSRRASTSGPRSRSASTGTAPLRCCERRMPRASGSAPLPTRCSARASRPPGARSQSGVIGAPLFAQTTFQTQGPDLWHPSPQFLFAHGAGPLLDMGPYYFSALVSLLGPVDRVAAVGHEGARRARDPHRPERRDPVPRRGAVDDPGAHRVRGRCAGAEPAELRLRAGAARRHGDPRHRGLDRHPRPEPVHRPHRVREAARCDSATAMSFEQPWVEVAQKGTVVGRGLGLLDMVRAIAAGRPHVASGELGPHVLDIMLSAEESAATASSCPSTAPSRPWVRCLRTSTHSAGLSSVSHVAASVDVPMAVGPFE